MQSVKKARKPARKRLLSPVPDLSKKSSSSLAVGEQDSLLPGEVQDDSPAVLHKEKTSVFRYLGDFKDGIRYSPTEEKRRWCIVTNLVEKQRKQIIDLKQRERRLIKRVATLSVMLNDLKFNKSLIVTDYAEEIEEIITDLDWAPEESESNKRPLIQNVLGSIQETERNENNAENLERGHVELPAQNFCVSILNSKNDSNKETVESDMQLKIQNVLGSIHEKGRDENSAENLARGNMKLPAQKFSVSILNSKKDTNKEAVGSDMQLKIENVVSAKQEPDQNPKESRDDGNHLIQLISPVALQKCFIMPQFNAPMYILNNMQPHSGNVPLLAAPLPVTSIAPNLPIQPSKPYSLKDIYSHFAPPDGWLMHLSNQQVFFSKLDSSHVTVMINFTINEKMETTLEVYGTMLDPDHELWKGFPGTLLSDSSLNKCFNLLKDWKPCKGNMDERLKQVFKNKPTHSGYFSKHTGAIHSRKCTLLMENKERCKNCQSYRGYLRCSVSRLNNSKAKKCSPKGSEYTIHVTVLDE